MQNPRICYPTESPPPVRLGRWPNRAVRNRQGAAAVEFALVAPILFGIILGIFEMGRAMMVNELINNAARVGARVGTSTGSTNANVTTAVNTCLAGLSSTTTTIKVNGGTADVGTAARNDLITVQITVPYSSVSWLPTNTFLGNAILSGSTTMYHE